MDDEDPIRARMLDVMRPAATSSADASPIDPFTAAKFYRTRAAKFLTHADCAQTPSSRQMYRRLAAMDIRLAGHAERDAAARRCSSPANASAMVSDRDLYRGARLLMDQQGDEVRDNAAARADRLLKAGDVDGAALWRRLLAAVQELQRGRRPGEAVN